MSEKLKDGLTFALILASSIGGFFVGKKQTTTPELKAQVIEKSPEIAVVKIEKISDDLLEFILPKNTRLVWSNGKNSAESAGSQTVPLGQIDNENSKKLSQFKYLGNAKTKKFYPATSYPARGTEIRYRRFFDTKKAAQAAGFIPSKLVK